MIPLVVPFLLFAVAMGKVAADIPVQHQPRPLPDLLMEEVMLDSFINSLSPIAEDHPSQLFQNKLEPIVISEQDIGFFLFTRENPNEPVSLKLGDVLSLRASNFSNLLPTKVLIHGWTDNGSGSWLKDVRRNYLKAGDFNVIIIDWGVGASKDYKVSARLTKPVGEYVAKFLEFVMMEGVTSIENLHILGHSLGAHVAGFIGSSFSGKVSRITGLDPARPDFEVPVLKDPKDRLDSTDAVFVDIIHTCAGTAGFVRPIGHVDFYPNGGSFRQPGCPVLMTQYCSHARSHQFMGESVINPLGFPAVECDGWKEFKSKKCDKNKNRVVYMGEKLNPNTRGVYFLETNANSPFGRGEL